jgi:methyl-accepting chemotaxis protein
MQYLTLLMVQAPGRVAVERERLEQLFGSGLEVLQKTLESGEAYQRQLDQRLSRLPVEIADGISPRAIAANINESLHREFVRSTIPETARALAVAAAQMKEVSAGFKTAASTLADSYRGAAEAARRSIENMESSISQAAATARRAANDLSMDFQQEYRWSLYAVSGFGILVGVAFGMMLHCFLA